MAIGLKQGLVQRILKKTSKPATPESGGGSGNQEVKPPAVELLKRKLVETHKPEEQNTKVEVTTENYKTAYLEAIKTAYKIRQDAKDGIKPVPLGWDQSILSETLKIFEDQKLLQGEDGKPIDIENLKPEMIDKFLATNQEKGILLGLKLMEWKGSVLSAVTGYEYDVTKPGQTAKEGDVQRSFKIKILENGDVTGVDGTPLSWWQDYRKSGGKIIDWPWKVGGKVIEVSGRRKGTPGHPAEMNVNYYDHVDVTNITDDVALRFIDELGIGNLDLQTSAGVKYLVKTMTDITATQTELFTKTGGKLQDFDPNFTKKIDPMDVGYDPTRPNQRVFLDPNNYYLGETAKSTNPYRLSDMGSELIVEIRKDEKRKAEKKLKEGKDERNTESTHRQLEKRRAEVEKSNKERTKDEITEKDNELTKAKKDAEDELKVVIRHKTIEDDIKESDKLVKEAGEELKAVENEVKKTPKYADADFLKWEAGVNEPLSWKHDQREHDDLQIEYDNYDTQLKTLNEDLAALREDKPDFASLKRHDVIDPATGKVVGTDIPDPEAVQYATDWRKAQKDLLADIKVIKNKMNKDDWNGTGKSLSQILAEKEIEYKRKQTLVEEPENAEVIKKYRDAEKAKKKLEDEQKKTKTEFEKILLKRGPNGHSTIATLNPDGSDIKLLRQQINEDIRKATTEIEKNAEGDLDAKREIDSLDEIMDIFTSSNKSEREENIKNWETNLANGVEPNPYQENVEFKDYSETVKQVMRLIYGEKVFTPTTEAEEGVTNKVRALLQSNTYLSAVVEAIETNIGISIRAPGQNIPIAPPSASRPNELVATVDSLFTPAEKNITFSRIRQVDRKMVESVIESLRKRALLIN